MQKNIVRKNIKYIYITSFFGKSSEQIANLLKSLQQYYLSQ